MKLLIVTQVVDKNHPILGFFHAWIEEFAKKCEKVSVICLESGEYDLPENVTVYSLGKERGGGRLIYLWRFYKYVWSLRHQYDFVFAHMNPEYVIAGFIPWKILRKKSALWYTHGSVSRNIRIAEKLVDHIFTAAKEGCNLHSKKVEITGHGIAVCNRDIPKEKEFDLVTVGRIAPSKNLESLVDMLKQVRKEKPSVVLTIIGNPVTKEEKRYKKMLEQYIRKQGLTDAIVFAGSVPHDELYHWLIRAKVFVSAATNGSLDKVFLEALMCSLPVVTSAEGAKSLPLEDWQVQNIEEFARRVVKVVSSDTSDRQRILHSFVMNHHSLSALIPKICYYYISDL